MNSAKVVYITGCLGFIGEHVTEKCLSLGWMVRGIDKITYAARPELLQSWKERYPRQFVFENKDINDLTFLYDCDYIINTAAETHVDNSIINSDDFIRSNIDGVHHLLQLIRTKSKFKMPTLLHMSTDEVYGDIEHGSHKETDLLKPSNPYSATKAAADMLIIAWARTYKIPYVIVRPTNNYGIGQYVEKLIPKTSKLFRLGKKVPLHNNGSPIRTWLHAADTADAMVKIVETGVTNEIFNISGNYETSNLSVVSQIFQLYKDELPGNMDNYIDHTYSRDGQDVRYSIDDTKLKNLGWVPTRNFATELPKIVFYYKFQFVW